VRQQEAGDERARGSRGSLIAGLLLSHDLTDALTIERASARPNASARLIRRLRELCGSVADPNRTL